MIYWLIGILVFFLIVAYFFRNRDVMAPSVLLTVGYVMASICCLWNVEKWGVKLHQNTVVIILLGVGCFIIGDFLAAFFNSDRNHHLRDSRQPHAITISNIIVILFSLFNILVLVLSIVDMLRITGGWLQTLGNTIGLFRNKYSYTDEMVNPWVVQLLKVSKASSYVFLYVFINNVYVGKREKKRCIKSNIKFIIPIAIYILITLFRGGRNNLITIAVASLFIMYFVWHRQVGWGRSISAKFLKRIIIFFALFIGVFFLTRTLVGRQSKLPFMEYVTTYFGGSIELLDQYMNSQTVSQGNETFPGMMSSLYKLGVTSESVHKSLEFRYSSSGVEIGNIYTGLRRFYNDYGYYGVIIMQLIYGFFMGSLYARIKKIKAMSSGKLFLVLFYATIIHAPVIQAMEDTFWINLSLGYFIEVIVLYVCTAMLMDYKIKPTLKITHHKWKD